MPTQRRTDLYIAIIRFTTKALPAWQSHCEHARLKPNLIPRDVVTRWNSTYDMLCFALRYRPAIDKITVDKKLSQFRKFELDDREWKVVEDLVSVLEVVDVV